MDAYGGSSQHTPAAPAVCGATGAQKQQGNQLQPQPGVLVKLLESEYYIRMYVYIYIWQTLLSKATYNK